MAAGEHGKRLTDCTINIGTERVPGDKIMEDHCPHRRSRARA